MNKRKRVALHKHRVKRKKLEEKHRQERGLPVRPATGRPVASARGGPASGGGGRRERSP